LGDLGQIVIGDPSGGEVNFHNLAGWISLKGAASVANPGGDVGLVCPG
jgi:hypothetical protein